MIINQSVGLTVAFCLLFAFPKGDAGAQRHAVSDQGCCPESRTSTGRNLKMVSFSEFTLASRRDAFPEEGASGVLGLRAVSVNRRGQVLAVDSRMRRVTIRSPLLQTIVVVGREGEGPGEYRQPIFGMFGLDGRIWLIDAVLGRISIYSVTGEFIRALPRPYLNARELIAVSDTTVLILGAVPVRETYAIATLVSESGRTLWQGIPADTVLRATTLILDGVWGARSPDGSAVVGIAVSPNISRIDVSTGRALCASRVPSVAWTQLDAAKRPGSGLGPTRNWIEQASSIQRSQSTGDGRVVLAIVQKAKADGEQFEWIVFDGPLNPTLRVRDVPGRLLLIRADTAWIAAEADDGRQVLIRSLLRPNVERAVNREK